MRRAPLLAALLLAAGCSGGAPPKPEFKVERTAFTGHRSPIVAVAVATSCVVTRGGDGTIRWWPGGARSASSTVRPEGIAREAPKSKALKIGAIERADGPTRLSVPNDQLLAVRPDGSELVASVIEPALLREKTAEPRRGGLVFLDREGAPKDLWTFDERWGCPTALLWSPDGKELAVAFSDAHIRIFARDKSQVADLATYRNRSQPESPLPVGVVIANEARVVCAMAYSPDSRRFAAAAYLPDGGKRCQLLLWTRGEAGFVYEPGKLDPPAKPEDPPPKRLGDLSDNEAPMIASLAFAPDGATIACAGWIATGVQKSVPGAEDEFGIKLAEVFGRAWLVAARSGQVLATFDGEMDAPITAAGFLDADQLVLGAFRSLKVWLVSRHELLLRLDMPSSPASAYAREKVLHAADLAWPGLAIDGRVVVATNGAALDVITEIPPPKSD